MTTTELWLLALLVLVCIIGGMTVWLIDSRWRTRHYTKAMLDMETRVTTPKKLKRVPSQRACERQGY